MKRNRLLQTLTLSYFSEIVLEQGDKRRATGRDFIMCLSIRDYKGSSEADWNEEPGAYAFKSQLSQAPSLLYNREDSATGISFDSMLRDALTICMWSLDTQ